jgi:hypothetical protein
VLVVVGPLGFVPAPQGDMQGRQASGDDSVSRFFALFPFFFFGKLGCVGASLAGGEINDKELSCLRSVHFRRGVVRCAQAKGQLSKMWQFKKLERWKVRRSFGKYSAVSLQRLQLSFFETIMSFVVQPLSSLFFLSLVKPLKVLVREALP